MFSLPKNVDKSRGINAECGDGAKYMSYIKVSKEQHERVKSSMRHFKTGIQSRSLNHVLGVLDGFRVQPYEMFEEEEKQKLCDHWLHLAKKDLYIGFENWKSWRSAKCQLTKSLSKELEDKWKLHDQPDSNLNDQYEENSRFIRLELNDDSVFDSVNNHNAENQETSMQIEPIKQFNQTFVVEYTENTVDEPQFRPSSASSELWQAQSSFMHRRSNGGDSFYNPYVNQDHNELLLNPFLKDPLSRPAFDPTGSDALLGPGRFKRNVCSPLPLVTSNHSVEEMISSIPRLEHLLQSNNGLDWSVNGVNVPMPASSLHHQSSHNWFSCDEVADESLFGVLSRCNGRLRSGVHVSSSGAMEQFVQPGNYVRVGRGPILPATTNVVSCGPTRVLGLNYMSWNEGGLGWMNLPCTMQETG
ncbi:uncharacterized protein [Rutidosis leptorrhynchoides]|uniref:uncharacterized protein n=1 Tax=Rutidosis leptorrhynchoides TaxID=125765 RepID=UPI003A993041